MLRMTWRTWLLVGRIIVVTLLAITTAVFLLPQQLARPIDQAVVAQLTEEAQQLEAEDRRLQSQNAVRTSLLQAVGGFVLALGLAATWVTVLINRQGQITERFTRAVDQLGDSSSVDVRLGGIYGLQRIAKESGPDRSAIVDVLAAYVRGHSPSSSSGDSDPDWWGAPLAESADEADAVLQRAPDVHAAMLAVSEMNRVVSRSLDLSSAYLVGIDLRTADLRETILAGADLTGADLRDADLRRADLRGANLRRADLRGANLRRADLRRADLRRADLRRADLTLAGLTGADLTGATLWDATLTLAGLIGADLTGADLRGADLTGANLTDATLRGDLRGATLTDAILQHATLTGARADSHTIWPRGLYANQRRQRGVVELGGEEAEPTNSA